jgi:hypothetical protein
VKDGAVSLPDPDLTTGLIIVRLWPAADGSLRAHLTFKPEVDGDEVLESAAGSVDSVCAQVRAWSTDFLARVGGMETG